MFTCFYWKTRLMMINDLQSTKRREEKRREEKRREEKRREEKRREEKRREEKRREEKRREEKVWSGSEGGVHTDFMLTRRQFNYSRDG